MLILRSFFPLREKVFVREFKGKVFDLSWVKFTTLEAKKDYQKFYFLFREGGGIEIWVSIFSCKVLLRTVKYLLPDGRPNYGWSFIILFLLVEKQIGQKWPPESMKNSNYKIIQSLPKENLISCLSIIVSNNRREI